MSTPSWDSLFGQDEAVAELHAEMARGRLHHAYLFEGITGCGRLTLARLLAGALLCESGTHCGTCKPCRMLAGGTHPDYLELPRDATQLNVGRFVEDQGGRETIEHTPVLSFLHLKSVEGERRVVIIPDAERMNESAANAFLKTLEEPPAGAFVLMTTSARDRLLGTIVSRCRRVRVCPLPTETVQAELVTRTQCDPELARDLATLSEGSLGMALELATTEAADDWRWLDSALRQKTASGAIQLAEGLITRATGRGGSGMEKRRAAIRLLDMTALHIRRKLREGLHPLAAEKALQALWTGADQLTANVRLELTLHTAALNAVAALRRG